MQACINGHLEVPRHEPLLVCHLIIAVDLGMVPDGQAQRRPWCAVLQTSGYCSREAQPSPDPSMAT